MVVEEYMQPGSYISLRTLQEKIGDNKLMMKYFSEKSYAWSFILQSLRGLLFLNQHGHTHGDLSCQTTCLRFDNFSAERDSFRVQLIDFLHIKDLLEIALKEVRFPLFNQNKAKSSHFKDTHQIWSTRKERAWSVYNASRRHLVSRCSHFWNATNY